MQTGGEGTGLVRAVTGWAVCQAKRQAGWQMARAGIQGSPKAPEASREPELGPHLPSPDLQCTADAIPQYSSCLGVVASPPATM